MNGGNEDNDFTKILTTTPPSTSSGIARSTSWFKKDNDQLVTCPSCKGSGIKESTTELVALIPYSDERLQPRYTTIKIGIALAITAVIIGSLLFVFYPRHAGAVTARVRIRSGEVYSADQYQYKTYLILEDEVKIYNANYFPIVIDSLNISFTISWTEGVAFEVGNTMIKSIQIPAHIDNLTIPYDVHTTQYPVDRLYRTCCYLFAGHFIWYRVTINARYNLAFVGNYYFSSSDVTTVPVECDQYKNSNISCHYIEKSHHEL